MSDDDAGGADNIWQHASETRSTSIAEGEAREPEAGTAIAPADEPGASSQDELLPPAARAGEQLVSPWEQPETGSGSAALETPRFELRSAPMEDIPTAAPGTFASSSAGRNGFGRLEIAPSLIAIAKKSGWALASGTNGRPEITMIGMAGLSW